MAFERLIRFEDEKGDVMYENLEKETLTKEIEGSVVELINGSIEKGFSKKGQKATVKKNSCSAPSRRPALIATVDGKELLFEEDDEPDVQGEAAEEEGKGKRSWFCQEAWTPRSGGGKGIHETKIWNWRGRHFDSSWQDRLVRKRVNGDEKTRGNGKL